MLRNARLRKMTDLLLLIMPTIKYICLRLEMHVPSLTLYILYFPQFATDFMFYFGFSNTVTCILSYLILDLLLIAVKLIDSLCLRKKEPVQIN